jgi:C-terminal region of peptidase_M24
MARAQSETRHTFNVSGHSSMPLACAAADITFAAIDKTLVDTELLSRDELRWWDDYHAHVLEVVGPQLTAPEDAALLAWLTNACAGLGRG